MEKINYGVYKIPLILNESVEVSKQKLKDHLIKAQINIKNFAQKHNWDNYLEKPFINKVYIFKNQSNLKKELTKITNAKMDDFPDKISAVVVDRKLYILSPEAYLKVYPEGNEKSYYEKLITHELAHQFHMRILKGKENAMGPIWFYEGFAIFVADQFKDFKMDSSDICKVINSNKRVSYKYYGAVIRFLLKYFSLKELVKNAKRDDFIDWLKNNYR